MVHQYKLQELMKATDEQTEREKVMAKELAALREMVNQPTQPVQHKDVGPSESEKALIKNAAKRLLDLRAEVRL
jgi:hypothetical protein